MDTFYRQSFMGKSLMKTLAEKLQRNEITKVQASQIMKKFDVAIQKVFDKVNSNISFKGYVKSYNNVDGVWKLQVTDFEMIVDNHQVIADKVKIVAVAVDNEFSRKKKKK